MVRKKIALITGANGQDGYFLSKYMKRSGVGTVVGIVRPCEIADIKSSDQSNLRYYDKIIEIDLTDAEKISALIVDLKPDYLLNFGAIAGSMEQLKNPEKLLNVNLNPVVVMLETLKVHKLETLFIQASSSETFAGGKSTPQDIMTPKIPRTIYGATKIAADNMVSIYRTIFGVNCFSVVLFSHESPLRKDTYFTKKIILQAFDLLEGKADTAIVYTPDAVRDWGYAGDYCKEIVALALKGQVKDRIIATGITTSVREFAQKVFSYLDISYDEYVEEVTTYDGRAPESLTMVGANHALPSFFTEKKNMQIDDLIKLLIRYEKKKRK